MPSSDAQKKAMLKYQKKSRKVVAVNVSIDEYIAFNDFALKHGINISKLVLFAVREYIAEHEEQ